MQLSVAGATHMGSSNFYTPQINQFAYKLTGADVMSWKPKSRLQKLVERLIQSVTQVGQP